MLSVAETRLRLPPNAPEGTAQASRNISEEVSLGYGRKAICDLRVTLSSHGCSWQACGERRAVSSCKPRSVEVDDTAEWSSKSYCREICSMMQVCEKCRMEGGVSKHNAGSFQLSSGPRDLRGI